MQILRRTELENLQEKVLAPYACSVKKSQGRAFPDEPDDFRMDFQRDRDRIIHTRAFRRLQGKTQVFFAGAGDHFRNRLTHTLEVQQISRDLARGLGLNEDLAESIALAHDLGHTPFAHAGQEALHEIMKKYKKSFEHNLQSRRIVELLESPYPHFTGLNLTLEVREGLSKHIPVYNVKGEIQKVNTLEAELVDIADEMAYYHHDLDDGFRAGLLDLEKTANNVYLVKESYDVVSKKYGINLSSDHFLGRLLKRILHNMIRDLFVEGQKRILRYNIKSYPDVLKTKEKIICFSDDMLSKVRQLRRYLYDVLYHSELVTEQGEEGKKIITYLFDYYVHHVQALPEAEQKRIAKGETPEEVVKDYIAGMTDRFAVEQYRRFFPKQKIKAIQMSLLTE